MTYSDLGGLVKLAYIVIILFSFDLLINLMDQGFKVIPEKKPLTDKKDKNTNNANTCTLKEIGRAGSCLS